MLLPEPNPAFRKARRADVSGFDRILCASIDRMGQARAGGSVVTATGITPASFDDLVRITRDATEGMFELDVYGEESGQSGLMLPLELHEPRVGDVYVFGRSTRLHARLTEYAGYDSYAPSDLVETARTDEPFGFAHYLADKPHALFELVNGDLMISSTGRLRRVARGVVRPRKVRSLPYGELN